MERLDIPMDIISVPEAYPAINPAYRYPVGGGGAPAINADMIPPLLARLKSVDRLWIVARNSALFDPDGLIDAALAKKLPLSSFSCCGRGR
ncbi:MAG: hypothetical protein EP345_03610 [Sphingomonadales bacterium]|nr:MAG: hypothetical protein EP345_03610 [Sphingomonadales bacterium]